MPYAYLVRGQHQQPASAEAAAAAAAATTAAAAAAAAADALTSTGFDGMLLSVVIWGGKSYVEPCTFKNAFIEAPPIPLHRVV